VVGGLASLSDWETRRPDSVEEVDEVEDITEEEMTACTVACSYQSGQLDQAGNLAL